MAAAPAIGAALQSVIDRFGGRVVERETVAVIGTGQSSPLGNNPDRIALVAVNLSPNVIYAGLDGAVSSARGIAIGANGGSMALDVIEDFTLPSREWHFVSTAAASNLYLLEVVRDVLAEVS